MIFILMHSKMIRIKNTYLYSLICIVNCVHNFNPSPFGYFPFKKGKIREVREFAHVPPQTPEWA